jgi:hypothetical protein
VDNYRPIALLPTFYNVLEKLVYDKLVSFLARYDLNVSYQFGFTSNLSTTDALVDFISKIISSLENGSRIVCLFCNFSKAFDRVDTPLFVTNLNRLAFVASHFFGLDHIWLAGDSM